ncbi:MAG: SCO family protein [Methylophilaceae bacterium]
MSENNKPDAMQKRGNGRKALIMLALVFVLPFTIAVILHALDIRPSGQSFGNLITPPVGLTIPVLQDTKGKPFTATNWHKKWNIVMLTQNGCDDACLEKIDYLSKVHASLHKEIKRVQRILLIPTEASTESIARLHEKFPDLIILTGKSEGIAQFSNQFQVSPSPQSVYLVDPLGNLMMQYPQDFQPKDLREDLVRLLKNSWAG